MSTLLLLLLSCPNTPHHLKDFGQAKQNKENKKFCLKAPARISLRVRLSWNGTHIFQFF